MDRSGVEIILSSVHKMAPGHHIKNFELVQGSVCRFAFVIHVIAVVAGNNAGAVHAMLFLHLVNNFMS